MLQCTERPQWLNFPEQRMEAGVGRRFWNGRKHTLGERSRLFSDKEVEKQGAGSGAVGPPTWAVGEGE